MFSFIQLNPVMKKLPVKIFIYCLTFSAILALVSCEQEEEPQIQGLRNSPTSISTGNSADAHLQNPLNQLDQGSQNNQGGLPSTMNACEQVTPDIVLAGCSRGITCRCVDFQNNPEKLPCVGGYEKILVFRTSAGKIGLTCPLPSGAIRNTWSIVANTTGANITVVSTTDGRSAVVRKPNSAFGTITVKASSQFSCGRADDDSYFTIELSRLRIVD